MIRTTSFAMVVAAVAMTPLIGLAEPAAAPPAGSNVPPTAPAPVRGPIALPPKLVVQLEGKQTGSGTDWIAIVVATMGFVSGLTGALVTARVARKTGETNARTERETAETNARVARQIEDLKKGLEFRLSSDRTVLDKRMHHYERLLAVLQNFPKYPEPRPLGAAALKTIATMLQDLYFGGAGIYMSPGVRDGYFDLQDGIRIVLSKAKEITLSLPDPKDDVKLRKVLERPPEWTIPPSITALLDADVDLRSLQSDVLESIRKLGSELRTRMAADLDSRRELADRGARPPDHTRTTSG